MWPFRPKKTKLTYPTICSLCFERYGPGEIAADYPMCPDCSSEAMEIEVENFASFMASKTYADLEDALQRWQQVEGFRPAYKEAKASRIRALRDEKALQS
jgi:hypothetical protein